MFTLGISVLTGDRILEKEAESDEESTSSFQARNGLTVEQNACQKEALKLHNSLRARHGVPALVLDNAISRKAQAYAQYLFSSGRFQHSSDRDGLGENVYSAWSSVATERTGFGTQATQSWYDEIKQYNFNRVVVAQYGRAGNRIESFPQNVPLPR